MPFATTAPVTGRADIGPALEQYDVDADSLGYVAMRILPAFETQLQSGTFGKIPLKELKKKATDITRAPGSGYARMNWKWETDSYATVEYGAEIPVDDREAAMYQTYLDAELSSARLARNIVLEAAEVRAAAAIVAGVTNTSAAGTAWSTLATAAPITNVDAAKIAVRERTGIVPDTVMMSWKAFLNCRKTDQVVSLLKYQNFQDVRPENITAQALASVFDVRQVIVAGVMQNTAIEGQAALLADIWDETKVLVCKVATTNSLREPCVGRTFHWSADGSSIGTTFESYYEVQVRGNVIRHRHDVQEKILYGSLGQIITGAL